MVQKEDLDILDKLDNVIKDAPKNITRIAKELREDVVASMKLGGVNVLEGLDRTLSVGDTINSFRFQNLKANMSYNPDEASSFLRSLQQEVGSAIDSMANKGNLYIAGVAPHESDGRTYYMVFEISEKGDVELLRGLTRMSKLNSDPAIQKRIDEIRDIIYKRAGKNRKGVFSREGFDSVYEAGDILDKSELVLNFKFEQDKTARDLKIIDYNKMLLPHKL